MKQVLVIRKHDEFSQILKGNNFEVVNLPLIETKEIEDLSDFEAQLEPSENYDGIFLTSEQAAQILVKKLLEKNTSFNGKVYVLGGRGFEILKEKIVQDDIKSKKVCKSFDFNVVSEICCIL